MKVWLGKNFGPGRISVLCRIDGVSQIILAAKLRIKSAEELRIIDLLIY